LPSGEFGNGVTLLYIPSDIKTLTTYLHISFPTKQQAEFVGCVAADPLTFEDECPTVGQPCINGNPGEFCCRDACPHNYCTSKQAPP